MGVIARRSRRRLRAPTCGKDGSRGSPLPALQRGSAGARASTRPGGRESPGSRSRSSRNRDSFCASPSRWRWWVADPVAGIREPLLRLASTGALGLNTRCCARWQGVFYRPTLRLGKRPGLSRIRDQICMWSECRAQFATYFGGSRRFRPDGGAGGVARLPWSRSAGDSLPLAPPGGHCIRRKGLKSGRAGGPPDRTRLRLGVFGGSGRRPERLALSGHGRSSRPDSRALPAVLPSRPCAS